MIPKKIKKKMSLLKAVLTVVGELGIATLDAFFPRQYSYTKLWRPLLGLDRAKKLRRKTVSTILWRLKGQGLVECKGPNKIASWHLTAAGKNFLQENVLESGKERKPDGIARLVIFDIPERERKKRDMIRAELVGCGFHVLQKSVWIGKHPIAKSFITLIDELELVGKVHIFSIREHGTLEE